MISHLRTFLVIIGVSLSMLGCGILNTGVSDTILKKSMPEEFFYHTSGRCEDGTLNFVSLQGSGIMLWSDPAQVVVGQGALYLSKDLTFTLHYEEFTPAVKVFDTKISGKFDFNTETGEINFADLGSAQIITYDGRAALEVQFTKAINEPAIENQKVIFRIGRSLDGLDVSRPDYCHY